jgi:hypothetical protein
LCRFGAQHRSCHGADTYGLEEITPGDGAVIVIVGVRHAETS